MFAVFPKNRYGARYRPGLTEVTTAVTARPDDDKTVHLYTWYHILLELLAADAAVGDVLLVPPLGWCT